MKEFYKKHSWFRRIIDIIDDLSDRFVVLYWASLGLSIALPTIVVFYSLPNEIRAPISGLVSAAISLVLIPVTINYYNQRSAQKLNLYNHNTDLYIELSNIIIDLLSNCSENEKYDNLRLQRYIRNNYGKMCLSFKTSLIWDIVCLCEECEMSFENVNYYCEKILRKLRKQTGINDKFSFNNKAIKIIKNNKEEYKIAVHHGGKVGKAGKTLASKTSSKSSKSKAGKTLANHKATKH